MSSGDVEGLTELQETENIQVIGTCPCFSFVDGKAVCLNGDAIEDVDALGVHPEIIESSNGFTSHRWRTSIVPKGSPSQWFGSSGNMCVKTDANSDSDEPSY